MDPVKCALNVRKEKTDFLVVVEVIQPFAGEKCSEVLAAVFGSESVLVGTVCVRLPKERYKCESVKSFYCFWRGWR